MRSRYGAPHVSSSKKRCEDQSSPRNPRNLLVKNPIERRHLGRVEGVRHREVPLKVEEIAFVLSPFDDPPSSCRVPCWHIRLPYVGRITPARFLIAARAWLLGGPLRFEAYAGVDVRLQHVSERVHHGIADGRQQDQSLHDRIVAVDDGVDKSPSQPLPMEHGLDRSPPRPAGRRTPGRRR